MPAEIARTDEWRRRFGEAGLPLLSDDLKSQFGATLVHHRLVDLLERNGVSLRSTQQLVGGGNMDFLNLQGPERAGSMRVTKIQGLGGADRPTTNAHFGAEYVPFLNRRKLAFIRIEADAFGGTPFELELRMSAEDSRSAAGNVLDAFAMSSARWILAVPT